MPQVYSSAAVQFQTLVRKFASQGARNPLLAAAANSPQLYGQYRESLTVSTAPVDRSAESDAQTFDRELCLLSKKMPRGEAIAQLSRTKPTLFNAARAAGKI